MIINYYKLDGTKGFDPTVSAAAQTQLTAAAKAFTDAFTDNITLNFQVSFGALGAGILGQSNSNFVASTTYSGANKLLQSMVEDRTSADDVTALANVPTTDAHGYILTRANAKALGMIASDDSLDGKMTFNTAFPFDFTHTGSDATKYDFFGVATHEISELMGRNSFLVTNGNFNTYGQALDLFKRDGSKNLSFDGAVANSFSIDGGTTKLVTFNNLTSKDAAGKTVPNGDFADYADSESVNEAWRARSGPGQVLNVSATDLRVMDAIGYDKAATDIVLVIDTTGSMGPFIDGVKKNAIEIVNKAFGTTTPDSVDARIAIVGFKDASGVNGPGENTAVLKFTDQINFADRKSAAIAAINSLTVGGGGDTPEGDNSALLFATRDKGIFSDKPAGKPDEYINYGGYRKSASHKIILFTDAPIKDTGLAGQVTTALKNLNTVVTPGGIAETDVTLASMADLSPTGAAGEVGDEGVPGPIVPATPASLASGASLFAIQVGTDSSATSTLKSLATTTGGTYLAAPTPDELVKGILDAITLPPPASNTITGTAGNDVLTGTAAGDVILGLAGNDTLIGLGGGDTLDGGDGTDTADYSKDAAAGGTFSVVVDLSGTLKDATGKLVPTVDGFGVAESLVSIENLTGTDGTKLVSGAAFGDVLIGSSAANVISGLGGTDYIDGGAGDDSLLGGDGIDALVGGLGADNVDGGAGDDVILLGDYLNPTAADGNDIAHGGAGNDLLWGYAGNDQLFGGDGDDALVGNDFGGTAAGVDQMFGEAGNDTFFVGLGGSATMDGGDGNDKFFGGPGNDVMIGGKGSDYMFGDAGADTFIFHTADLASGDADIVYFFSAADGDTLQFDAASKGQITFTGANLQFDATKPDTVASVLMSSSSGWSGAVYGINVADLNAHTIFV